MIAGLRDIRTQLLVVVGVLVLLDLAAIVLLISPAGRSRGAHQQEFEQLRVKRLEMAQSPTSVQGMEDKITTAREQETKFNSERLAQRYSTMSEQLARIATEAGVGVSKVKYDPLHDDKNTIPGYDSIGITIQIHGSYDQDIRFINAVERQKMMFLIDGVSFGGLKDNDLTVSIHLSTYLRSAA